MRFSRSIRHMLWAVSAEVLLLLPGGDFLIDQWQRLDSRAVAQAANNEVSEEFTVCVLPVERMVAMGWDIAAVQPAPVGMARENGCAKPQ